MIKSNFKLNDGTLSLRKFTPIFYMVLAIIVVFIYQTFISDDVEENSSSISCDFERGKCGFENEFGMFLLSAEPGLITTESEIQFGLTHEDLNSVTIESAYLEGRDMYMGKIPLFFEKNNDQLIASTMIGACIEKKMVWQMVINAKYNDAPFTMSYSFYSYRS